MVRETGGVRAPDDGDGRRPVGHRAGVRGEPRWPADDNLLGPRGPRLEDAAPAIHANVRRDGPRFPESGDGNGTRPPREGPAASRVPRHRGVGRARGRGARWEGDLLPRLRPEPCPPPSDGHRPRDPTAVRADRRISGPDGLQPRRRLEFRGIHPSVLRRCAPRQGNPLPRGAERRGPEPPRGVPIRLRGPRRAHADAEMYTLGHRAEMKPVRGDGLRYHGCSPILSLLRHRGLIDTIAYPTDERHVFERARMFVQAEGFLPAPESAYSIACAID